jgi:GMP synthase (glutamine-hydrolysing)
MTILYIDTEHDRVLSDHARGPSHRAKLEEARARLSAAASQDCVVLHFLQVSLAEIEQIAPTALVLSGSATDWEQYEFRALEQLLAIIRDARLPILGICAGHQLIGLAHGAPWGPLGPLQEGEPDPDPHFGPGQRKQRGFLPVVIDPRCPLFHGLGDWAIFFQSHYWQLQEVPHGFVARASSLWSPIQAIERLDRPVFGVQFHPERFDTAHPAGDVVLRNFFAVASSR